MYDKNGHHFAADPAPATALSPATADALAATAAGLAATTSLTSMMDGRRRLLRARLRGLFVAGLAIALLAASFFTLDVRWGELATRDAWTRIIGFFTEFFPPETAPDFLARIAQGAWETLAMSVVGSALAAVAGLLLALPAGLQAGLKPGQQGGTKARMLMALARTVMNCLRAVPELVWAALLLVAAGLGPFAGTLALAVHTSGVLGRLFAEAIENAPSGPADALRVQGVGNAGVLCYATLPLVLPQLVSYTLYRWENNIRAATILGVVGAGGLGQMLVFHLGLFQMHKAATVIGAMLLLVVAADGLSNRCRRWLAG